MIKWEQLLQTLMAQLFQQALTIILIYKDIKRIVREDFNIKVSDIEIVSILGLIQNFDPPGCAYRSVEESLKIQVNNLNLDKKEQQKVIKSLTSLINQEIKVEDLNPKTKIQIDKLNLNQGLNFSSNKNLYLRPDLLAFSQKNSWQVVLNDDFMNKDLIETIRKEMVYVPLPTDDEELLKKGPFKAPVYDKDKKKK